MSNASDIIGLPGNGINGVFEALRKHKERLRFIHVVHVCHEEAAAFMACAYAKFTGRLEVCIATSGPGGIHLLNGLYGAKMAHRPVLVITGLRHNDLIGTFTFVIKNSDLVQIKWEQMVFLGNPEYACYLYLANFVTIARGAGVQVIQIEDLSTCCAQLDSVVGGPVPILIEAVVDEFTPRCRQKIKAAQALKLAEALVRGEPNRMKTVLTNAHEKVRELV